MLLLLAARLKRIQTPVCVTLPRGRRMTLTGYCFGRTVHLMPALISCGDEVERGDRYICCGKVKSVSLRGTLPGCYS
ncbi:hypothetical protein PAMP_002416 [Pampus punctatissimus]